MDKTRVENIDCIQGMKEFPDKYFDLAIVDPPYGIGITKQSGFGTFKKSKSKSWDDYQPSELYFKDLLRCSKNQIIWGGNYFFNFLPNTNCCVIWDKMNGTNDMADFELAWTSFDSPNRRFQMHHFSNGYDDKIHPTQKPTKLYKWLLKNYAKEGDKILDTHGGSMSSVIACLDMGFQITCYEIDTDYYNAGKNRITNHLSQLNAFRPAYDIEFHDNSGVSQLRNNAGIGYQEQKDGANNNPIHRVDGLFHGDPSQSDIQTPKAS